MKKGEKKKKERERERVKKVKEIHKICKKDRYI